MKNKIKPFIAVFAVIIFVTLVIFFTRPKKQVTNTNLEGAEYMGLTPGSSSRSDVLDQNGTPLSENRSGDTSILEYKSQSNPNFNNEFQLRSNQLVFVKQHVTVQDNISISDIVKKYGNYQNVLYGSKSQNGFDLYIYPDKGIAYVGHQQAGIVLEIWYFQPTNLQTFMSTFAKDYSATSNHADRF